MFFLSAYHRLRHLTISVIDSWSFSCNLFRQQSLRYLLSAFICQLGYPASDLRLRRAPASEITTLIKNKDKIK